MIATDPTPEKRRGGYYTPRPLADFLVRWAVRSPSDRALDPACGEAVFLEAVTARLQELGQVPNDSQVVGYELDEKAAEYAQRVAPNSRVKRTDFFVEDVGSNKFDAVVGNPPYIRYHYFSGETRTRALARARDEGVQLSRLTSSWAPFVIHAASFLAANGRMAFVLPAELLSTDYASPVREFLRRRFARVDVLTFEQRIFPGVLVDAILLLTEGTGPGEVRVHRLRDTDALVRFASGSSIPTDATKWTHGLISRDASEAMALIANGMQRLGSIATVDIGIVTGANGFFLLTDDEAKMHRLARRDLHRLVARGHQLPGYQISRAEWERQRRRGEIVWLFAPRSDSGAAGVYIRSGEKQGINRAYKCRIRKPWWRLKLLDSPDAILSYMSNHAPRMVANDALVLTTNLLHNVKLLRRDDPVRDSHLLALSWPNSATFLSCELGGRAYGGGVLKLETREAERILVPTLTPEMVDELHRRASAVDGLLRQGHLEAAADLLDPVVHAAVGPEARAVIRSAWLDLRERRRSRGTIRGVS